MGETQANIQTNEDGGLLKTSSLKALKPINASKPKKFPLLEGLLAGLCLFMLVLLLQEKMDIIPRASVRPFAKLIWRLPTVPKWPWHLVESKMQWCWPTLSSFLAFLIFSRSPGSVGRPSCVIVGYRGWKRVVLKWDRNSFCRGWLATGSTGSGKTECGINKTMHGVFKYECGVEKPSWKRSELAKSVDEFLKKWTDTSGPAMEKVKELDNEASQLEEEALRYRDFSFHAELTEGGRAKVELITKLNELENAIGKVTEELQEEDRKLAAQVPPDDDGPEHPRYARYNQLQAEMNLLEKNLDQTKKASQSTQSPKAKEFEQHFNKLTEQADNKHQEARKIEFELDEKRLNFQKQIQRFEESKYLAFPWGGVCVDEKGAYWQILTGMAAHYRREHHLMLLQTRPVWADPTWKPKVRFNLLSNDLIPSNTYADAIVTTASSVAGGEGDKGFFKTQAQSNIGWAIEFFRAVRDCQLANGIPHEKTFYPSLKRVLELLSGDSKKFTSFLLDIGALPKKVIEKDGDEERIADEIPASLQSPKLSECIAHFNTRYWTQPPDQLGGVKGTVYNYLNYFAADDVAEVFCSDNTFKIEDIDKGMILCVAMPQKLRVERRYVCTLLKVLFYNHVLSRFDGDFGWEKKCNLLILWQDEAQRFAITEDGNVDVIRQAQATTFMACQGKPSLYPILGGKEKANVTLLNLRNRFIFQAADLDCAQGSAEYLGKKDYLKVSKSKGRGGTSTSSSKEVKYKVEPHELMDVKKFSAYLCHADGKFHKVFLEPVTVDGQPPAWIASAMAAQGRKFEYSMVRMRKWISKKLFGEKDL